MEKIDTLNNNRFELLSAYLDHEVSIDERKRVEQWLTEDPEFYALYQRLLTLQRSCRSLPAPTSTGVERTIEGVFARIDARRRLPLLGTLAAAAVAATVGAIAGAWNGGVGSPQFADRQNSIEIENIAASIDPVPVAVEAPLPEAEEPVDPSGLMIALEHPPVDLPPVVEVSSPSVQD
jgi:anti-sigma factor RsiW